MDPKNLGPGNSRLDDECGEDRVECLIRPLQQRVSENSVHVLVRLGFAADDRCGRWQSASRREMGFGGHQYPLQCQGEDLDAGEGDVLHGAEEGPGAGAVDQLWHLQEVFGLVVSETLFSLPRLGLDSQY